MEARRGARRSGRQVRLKEAVTGIDAPVLAEFYGVASFYEGFAGGIRRSRHEQTVSSELFRFFTRRFG